MSLTGGKRKVNKSLKAWVTFVKKVQKEEKLSYKDAIHRAKIRKDKGEKWMTGGDGTEPISTLTMETKETFETVPLDDTEDEVVLGETIVGDQLAKGGKRRRRTMRRSRGRGRGRTARRSRGRASRRH